jgi:hypothetical protein
VYLEGEHRLTQKPKDMALNKAPGQITPHQSASVGLAFGSSLTGFRSRYGSLPGTIADSDMLLLKALQGFR